MLSLAASALLVAQLLMATTPARRTVTEYDVRFGPLRVVSLKANVALGDTSYRAESLMETVGMVALLFPWSSRTTSEGILERERFQPVRHLANGDFRGERRAVLIDYDERGAVTAVIEPSSEQDARDPVPPPLQQRTIDPLTATLAAIAQRCAGILPVFDGRRRYDMRLTDLGETDVPDSSDGIYRGRARHCRAEIQPLAGFFRADARRDERPTHLDYWIAAPRPDLPPVPVYLELSAPRGTLGIHLQRAEAGSPLP